MKIRQPVVTLSNYLNKYCFIILFNFFYHIKTLPADGDKGRILKNHLTLDMTNFA